MDGIWKKFRKGELFDSLRDALPALAAKLLVRANGKAPSPREFWAVKDVSLAVWGLSVTTEPARARSSSC